MQHKIPISMRLAGRPIRVTITCNSKVVARATFASGSDLTIGRGSTAVLAIPEWKGEDLMLVSAGHILHLQSGMRLHMCHDNGEDRVKGSFEELVTAGFTFPMPIPVSKVNVSINDNVSFYALYLAEGER